jgi:hypothetical protein
VILPGFQHRPGLHCGSTALADSLRVRGLDLSEPMVFGLGAGLGFYAFASPELTPSHLFQGRSAHLERTCCEVLGAPFRERTADDAAHAWEEARATLDRGLAPILSTDLARLPYMRTRTPFGGHRVVLAGHDAGRGVALLADTDLPALQEVPLEVLDAARASIAPPFGVPGRPWLEVDAPQRPPDLGAAVREALRRQARDLLADVDGSAGISALERFAEELPAWPRRCRDEADRSFAFRYAWQVIEKRGTGGALFRALYARFLGEAEGLEPAVGALGLRLRMEEIAAAWSAFAAGLRAIAGVRGGEVPPEVAAAARDLARRERGFFEDVAARVR